MKKHSRPARAKSLSALPPTWVVGFKARLRAIEPADVAMLQCWVNTSPAREWLLPRFPFSQVAEADWAARVSADPNQGVYIIQTLDGRDIGTIGLVMDGARTALGVAIHDERYWNNGYGKDAVRTLVAGAFRVLPFMDRVQRVSGELASHPLL